MSDKTIDTIINKSGPNFSYISVVPYSDNKLIELVIGANYEHACAMRFNKSAVLELVVMLVEIANKMES